MDAVECGCASVSVALDCCILGAADGTFQPALDRTTGLRSARVWKSYPHTHTHTHTHTHLLQPREA